MLDPGGPLDPGRERRGIGVGAGDQRVEAAVQLGPFQRPDIVLDREHRGRVDRLALEDALDQLAALGQPEDLGQRPGRRHGSPAARPRAAPRISTPCAALAAEHLLPGEGGDIELVPGQVDGERRRGRVADGEARAVVGDPVAVGHAHARSGAVPGEDDVAVGVDRGEIGQLRRNRARTTFASSFSCLTTSVTQPSPKLSQASRVTGRAPSRVHSAISTAPVSEAGTMPMRCVGGDAQHVPGQLDGVAEPRLAELRAVRAAERSGGELFGGPARRLRAGAGREKGPRGARGRLGYSSLS